MSYLKLLPKTTVKVSSEYCFLGTGVLLKIGNDFFVITAAHVVFGENLQAIDTTDLKELIYISEQYGKLAFLDVVGTQENQKKHDIVPIKVECLNAQDYPNVNLCSDVSFPEAKFVFRGTARSVSLIPHSIPSCVIDTLPDIEYKFHLRIPHEDYSNAQGESGPEVLQGYSGSGVFFQDSEKFWLVGIVLSVGNDNFNGVICRSILVLKNYFFPTLNLEDFHGGNARVKAKVSDLRKEITQELIEERKTNAYGDVENLTKKMNAFLPFWSASDLDQFIADILIWENLERRNIRHNDEYKDLVDEAKAVLASGNKKYFVNNPAQGNERFHKIQDEFNSYLIELFDNSPLKINSRTIAAGELAKMLANCNLDFRFTNDYKG